MKIIWAFILAIPELVKLLDVLQKRMDEAATSKKIASDVKSIHEAFSEKDPKKLHDLFNS